ncbi:MAG TPA: aminodeoxychorismate/anthranilate synthase component II [Saprospiraceae bacterium]|nr:aminodeoxychorismate/anthranilate synthase component II [Saprospiraceae bacterium]
MKQPQSKVLIIDNYDSFTFNLAQLLEEAGAADLAVVKKDQVSLEQVRHFEKIVFSPGPDLPAKAPVMYEILENFADSKSILGVCLGHQAIGEFFGGKLFHIGDVVHGISRRVTYFDPACRLFRGLETGFDAGVYHSWAVSPDNFPASLYVSARSEEGLIMGIAHRVWDVQGIQFHPESYLTPAGQTLIKNWLNANTQ